MDIISYNKAVEAMEKAQTAYDEATKAMEELQDAYMNGSEVVKADAIRTTATNLYLETNDGWVRVTDNKGYNDDNPNYMPIIASEFRIPNGAPQYVTEDKIQGGRVLVDNLVGNETVEYDVSFPHPFESEPVISCTLDTTVPEKMQPVSVTGVSKTGFTMCVQRTNDTATWVQWIAINMS